MTVLTPKEIERQIKRYTRSEKDIAEYLGIKASHLSLFKTGTRRLNPKNPRHINISRKLQTLNSL
jgi:hypothetical protein